jgi:hypothetical protein
MSMKSQSGDWLGHLAQLDRVRRSLTTCDCGGSEESRKRNKNQRSPELVVVCSHNLRHPKSMAVRGGRPIMFAISAFTVFWYCAEIA